MRRHIFIFTLAITTALLNGCNAAERPAEISGSVTAVELGETTDTAEEAEPIEQAEQDESIVETESEATESEASEIPILRDCYEKTMGGYVGCAVSGTTIEDPKVFELMTTHFNAVTLENELKPDAIFNYSNSKCPGIQEAVLGDVTMEVPKLDFSRAEKMLDKIYDWNTANPDRALKVRGHVLLWHSQTPEWFFHENYDKKEPYVSKEVMDLRMEWYIKSVLEHFTGPESKYKDMFYGWDVLNEAVSDGSGTYRTDKESTSESPNDDLHSSNSSWWAVYQSEEYIVKAFTYANKYAPAELELYYNDYNECTLVKRNGILELLTMVKEHEGAPGEGTRISGMGMQGHYNMDQPTFPDIEYSIKAYSEVVGNVQITELDMRASEGYTRSKESVQEEYELQRKRYNMVYYGIKSAVNTDPNVNFGGITFWGVADHHSWLNSSSTIGGGNVMGLPCCPLLFDENYEPKPCFYVFADSE